MATNARGERDYDGRRYRGDRRRDHGRRDNRDRRGNDHRSSGSYLRRHRKQNENYNKYYDHRHNYKAERYYDDQLDEIKYVDRAYGRMNDGLMDKEIEYVSKELDRRLDKDLNSRLNALLDDQVNPPPQSVRRLIGQTSVHQTADEVKGMFIYEKLYTAET